MAVSNLQSPRKCCRWLLGASIIIILFVSHGSVITLCGGSQPVHPLLATLLCSFCLLTHLLDQAVSSLCGGCITLHIVFTCLLSGQGCLCLTWCQIVAFVSFAVTSTMTSVKTNKQHWSDTINLIICELWLNYICLFVSEILTKQRASKPRPYCLVEILVTEVTVNPPQSSFFPLFSKLQLN